MYIMHQKLRNGYFWLNVKYSINVFDYAVSMNKVKLSA